jgi:hypothetical protein
VNLLRLKKYPVLLLVVLLVTIRNAHSGQSTKPLGVTATVVGSCVLSVADGSIGDTSNLVRGRCNEQSVWKVDVDRKAAGNAQIYSVYTNSHQTVRRDKVKGDTILVTINF